MSAQQEIKRSTKVSFQEPPLPKSSVIIWIIGIGLLILLTWAWLFKLEEVSTGTGKVIPSSKEQVIQSLEGGILTKLNVKEGEIVEQGQVLAQLDPTRFEVTDIYQTSVCPLARVMRRELKARGIQDLKVVYSREEAQKPEKSLMTEEDSASRRRSIPGSVSFVPSVAGLIAAGEVIRDLIKKV